MCVDKFLFFGVLRLVFSVLHSIVYEADKNYGC